MFASLTFVCAAMWHVIVRFHCSYFEEGTTPSPQPLNRSNRFLCQTRLINGTASLNVGNISCVIVYDNDLLVASGCGGCLFVGFVAMHCPELLDTDNPLLQWMEY